MFAFHRPKIYRSANGCCICRAKSSSSRFTDSKKYENEFKLCFNLGEEQKRAGEICNACVLLIKRWKKLPKGTERNWNHVVDARAGPGGKSLLRSKLKRTPVKSAGSSHHGCCNFRKRKHRSAEGMRKMRLMDRLAHSNREHDKAPLSPTPSESSTDDLEDVRSREGVEVMRPKDRMDLPPSLRAILDTTYWKMERICCGTIFKGGRGEVLIEPTLFKPCRACSSSSSSSPASSPSSSPAKAVGGPGAGPGSGGPRGRETRPDSLGSDDSLDMSDEGVAEDDEEEEEEEDDDDMMDSASNDGDVLETLMGLSEVAAAPQQAAAIRA